MTQSFKFSGVRVLLGNGATPEVFAAPCGFTQRSLKLDKNLADSDVPPCGDEDVAPWTERDVTAKSASIEGEGVLANESLPTWNAFWASDTSKNARVELWRAGAMVGYYAGAFHLASFEIGAQHGERATANVSLQSDGAVAWADA